MINIEKEVYTKLYNLLTTEYSGIYVTGDYVSSPEKFPCVFIEEADNSTAIKDGSCKERFAAVMYEINVFSAKKNTAKTEAKKIINTIDTAMLNMGFSRDMLSKMPNMDESIYRITARYSALVSDNKTIFRR